VVFVAGVESHGGWYEKTLRHLVDRGISSYFIDRRGSGRSGGTRGDIPSLSRLQKDLEEFTDFIRREHETDELILAAISWGAKWALHSWSQLSPNPYRKLILITPGFFRQVDLPLSKKLEAGAASLVNPHALFPIPISTESFTQSPEKLNFLKEDLFRLKQVTAGFLKVNLMLDIFLKDLKGIFPQPVHLFEAGIEKIVHNEKNEEFLRKHFFDLKVTHYLKAYHTLEFEEGISYRDDLVRAILA
jgi:alpha-beta hydrolase superfamily lysophospholipase